MGSEYILEGINDKGELTEEAKEKVEKLLKQSFRPEFLNRLDEIVFYKPLTQNETAKILDLLIADLNKRLENSSPKILIIASGEYLRNLDFVNGTVSSMSIVTFTLYPFILNQKLTFYLKKVRRLRID